MLKNKEEKIRVEVKIILEFVRPACSYMIEKIVLIEREFKDRLFLNNKRRNGVVVSIKNRREK